MNARLVTEDGFPGNGAVGRNRTLGDPGNEPADLDEFLQSNCDGSIVKGSCSHCDLFQRSIAGTFADPVDRDTDTVNAEKCI